MMVIYLMLVEERKRLQCDENNVTCLNFGRCDVLLLQNEGCIDEKYNLAF